MKDDFRLQLDLSPSLRGTLDTLTERLDTTKADVTRQALDMLDHATDPKRGLFIIGADGVKRQLVVL